MNAVSELFSNRRKFTVRNIACLAAEGGLFQRTAPICGISVLERSFKSEFSPELSISSLETSLFSTKFARGFSTGDARIFVLTEFQLNVSTRNGGLIFA